MSAFSLLNPLLVEALAKKGIDRPTRPQELMIPAVLSGKNVLLIAPTGIGKTEAAVLPLLNRILKEKKPGVRLLYVTPLRALNRDMMERLAWFGERLGISIAVRHGDTTQRERARQVRNVPDILITTPETLQIMFQGKLLRRMLENVEWLVVDEIHELARDERGAQLAVAMERLLAVRGREYQRIGLSATVGSPSLIAQYLGSGRDVSVLNVVETKSFHIQVEAPEDEDGDEQLQELFELNEELTRAIRHCKDVVDGATSTLFFVNTRDTAELIGSRYAIWDKTEGFGVHHGSLSKEVRIFMEDRFKSAELKCLICTSSLELGIDVGQTDLSLQFNSPREVTRLIQRVGRAGHQVGETSKGKIVTWNPDDIMESAVCARMAMAGELEEQRIRNNPLNVLANQVISIVVEYTEAAPEHIYKLVKQSFPFRSLKREDFDSVVKALVELRQVYEVDGLLKKTRRGREYFYDNISMIPDQRSYRIVDVGSRHIIGTLDEGFVAGLADGYSAFITRGTTWRVVDIQDEEVLVEQAQELGALPSWVGEEIPI
ncbi:MAG TPA: DEAD/DEAH box helicase, partial [Euryarchaeota archaeon]|nr:DEAD/DEAH box helicase [Euryarchaeota archaeon]